MTNGASGSVPGPCPLCRATSLTPLFQVDERFSLAECTACRFVLTYPPVPASEIGAFYPQEYYGKNNRRFNPLFEWLVTRFRERRVREIERRVPSGRVLDIGCGRGITLAQMKARGWEVHGTEFSETSSALARAVVGDTIRVGDVRDAGFPPDFFDVVNIWHVLEHLPDPRAILAKCREILRPGGLLVIAVPNFESVQAGVSGPHWFHLDVPRHYEHFRLSVLRKLVEEHDFLIGTVSHFSFEQNPYGWIQSLLNRLGFRHNLLYDILKHQNARSVPHPFHANPLQCLLLVPALLVVFPLSLVLFLLEVVLKRGGTVELYAQCVKSGVGPRTSENV